MRYTYDDVYTAHVVHHNQKRRQGGSPNTGNSEELAESSHVVGVADGFCFDFDAQ
jgi:hypothetical protein